MEHAWILDVLTDLREYARRNDLVSLAERLDGSHDAAELELANRGVLPAKDLTGPDAAKLSRDHRRAFAASNDA